MLEYLNMQAPVNKSNDQEPLNYCTSCDKQKLEMWRLEMGYNLHSLVILVM